ncbi:MAG TPA: amidase [Candidatus Dormibacteraeota bacterium]|jgi:Asp-tRNA(Asn)/Glu-tRNA(Gln) amidotransferase A subunit family amidase|nr:amidase [Candidatus Dormibacteraeota bacterium]
MLDRRDFLRKCTGMGFAGTLLPGALWAQAQAEGAKKITKEMIDSAAAIADVPISEEYKEMMLENLNDQASGYEEIYKLRMPNSVAPALNFDPVTTGTKFETTKRPMRMSAAKLPKEFDDFGKAGNRPNYEALAFASVRELAELMRAKRISSLALTQMYLARLKKYDPALKFVVTLTEERALAQAKKADEEIAAGKYRGPLHGIPWGAKDLLATKGYKTTWGAGGFETQMIDEDATVVKRLDDAGAVLVAKLTLGALAQGDVWFGGVTRNPWNTKQGSSGSSAGPASATAAGCVAFSIGSETLGSISSPSTRCGCTGLRPSFGLVPRTGAMALSWSMDKLGPICRSVEDCALVLNAIYGKDGEDRTVQPAEFNWDATLDWRKLRVGYLKAAFEPPKEQQPEAAKEEPAKTPEEQKKRDEQKKRRELAQARAKYDRKFLEATLTKLGEMGVKVIPVELPKFPYGAMTSMLTAESAAAFDELTRTGRDKLLTSQKDYDWPNTFRSARFIPAVEYIQAARARTLLMEAMAKVFEEFDVIVTPSSGPQLTCTNLTGHPALILPNGFRGEDAPNPPSEDPSDFANSGGPGTPTSLTFLGKLYGEAALLAFAQAYQEATGFHLRHPSLATA